MSPKKSASLAIRTVCFRTTMRAATFRALIEAAAVIGGVQVRNAATVGGNLVNASPAADFVVPLLALDAQVELASTAGERHHDRRSQRLPVQPVLRLRVARSLRRDARGPLRAAAHGTAAVRGAWFGDGRSMIRPTTSYAATRPRSRRRRS